MSMDDSDQEEQARPRWPMSATNTALVILCVAGAIVCFAFGQILAGLAILLGALFGGLGAVFARRGDAGDLERVNALEYADERDRAAAVRGLAVVGVIALLLSLAQLVVFTIVHVDPLPRYFALGTFLALVAGWFFANWYFVRRG